MDNTLYPNDPYVQSVIREVARQPFHGLNFTSLRAAFVPLNKERFDPTCPRCHRPTVKVIGNGYWFRAEPKPQEVGQIGRRVWIPHDRVCPGGVPAGEVAAANSGR